MQAGVALHLLDRDPSHARGALEHIKAASRSALDEVRGVLGVLRSDAPDGVPLTPQQGLADLGRLVDGVRSAGLAVDIADRITGGPQPEPPWALQSAAYRIVQEALTNVLRHAGANRALVVLDAAPGALRITVDDDGVGVGDAPAGVGLLSMRGRAELLGGDLEVLPGPLGGTRVTARLPWGEAA